ncbi:HNH endonuclease [Paraburkholderia domus]|uniref:HNH endonuclease n=1 Tax=Paraburkholderia domus TaxID=2793075 RepID=UPI0039A7026C
MCFYCGETMPDDDTTIEHLVATTDGGTNHPSNLVLAHADCNVMAADLPVIGKVLLRERLRQKSAERRQAAARNRAPR